MITSADLSFIDLSYFNIKELTPFYIVLYSKTTGHYWHILEQDLLGGQSFYVSHKHHANDSYHPQTCRRSILACCQYIKSHDEYHLKRKSRRKRQSHTKDHKKKEEPHFSSAHVYNIKSDTLRVFCKQSY